MKIKLFYISTQNESIQAFRFTFCFSLPCIIWFYSVVPEIEQVSTFEEKSFPSMVISINANLIAMQKNKPSDISIISCLYSQPYLVFSAEDTKFAKIIDFSEKKISL